MIKEFKTHTGAIFCDTEKRLEWLYVGDYGKNANIKANFLGLTKEINGVEHRPVNLDCLQSSKVIKNDNRCVELLMRKFKDVNNPRCVITLEEVEL